MLANRVCSADGKMRRIDISLKKAVRMRYPLFAMTVATALVATPLAGQMDSGTDGAVDADALYARVAEHYGGLEGIAFEQAFVVGLTNASSNEIRTLVKARQPNLLRLEPAPGDPGDQQSPLFVSDGTTVSIEVPGRGDTVIQQPAGADFGGLLVETGFHSMGMVTFSMPLFAPSMFEAGADSEVEYLGREEVDGVEAHRLRARHRGIDPTSAGNLIDWTSEFLVAAEGDPWVLQVTPDLAPFAKEDGRPDVSVTVSFREQEANPAFAADTFVYTIREDVEVVGSIEELMEQARPEGSGPAVGEEVADFTLGSLGGEEVTLSSYRGEKIVVLDFWATWCPPCVRGLPVVTEVTSSMAGEGVVFWAVNLREDSETIRRFLEANDLASVPVLLDEEGAVGAAFGIQSIPTTLVIDREGRLAASKMGVNPDLAAYEAGFREMVRKVVVGN